MNNLDKTTLQESIHYKEQLILTTPYLPHYSFAIVGCHRDKPNILLVPVDHQHSMPLA